MRAIADTGFLVAHLNVKDQFSRWALDLAPRCDRPILTCEPVLAEASYLLGEIEPILGLLRDGLVQVNFELSRERASVEKLARIYADQNPDLADLCVVRMSELFPNHDVVTTDRRDFTVYRRNHREMIPLILPAE